MNLECPGCAEILTGDKADCPSCGRRTPFVCPKCEGRRRWVTEKTDTGAGCVILLIGLVFAPLLIGIPAIIYGVVLMGKSKSFWHCLKCGTKFPAMQS